MRSPSRSHSALRAPLNDILGTEVSVRIIRLLTGTTVPMSKAAIARRTSLNESGVGRAISELADLGIVASVGMGPRRLYHLREEHPLASPLADLFAAELARFDSLVDALRAAVRALDPPPRAAWIQGPVVAETDEPGDSVVVGILASAKCVDETVDQLRAGITALEREADITIAVHGLASPDLAALPDSQRADLDDTLPLLGPPPMELMAVSGSARTGTPARSHGDLDRRALALAQAIAEKLSEDPSLIDRARKYISRRRPEASVREWKELDEWDRILRTTSLARLRRLLVEPSERATRLRQTLPFVGALSAREREAIMKKHAHDEG